jgi:hypothetical protein
VMNRFEALRPSCIPIFVTLVIAHRKLCRQKSRLRRGLFHLLYTVDVIKEAK